MPKEERARRIHVGYVHMRDSDYRNRCYRLDVIVVIPRLRTVTTPLMLLRLVFGS